MKAGALGTGMKLIKVFQQFPDEESCVEFLERVRWPDKSSCPYCGAFNVARKADGGIGRWNCHGCKSSFNVLSGTVFQKTKVPLPKWFLAIVLIVNSKNSLSGAQLARDLEMNRGTARFLARRIRAAMADSCALVSSIAEADEDWC